MSIAAGAVLALGSIHTVTPQEGVTAAATQARATLRVGVWTLWNDRSVTIAPSGSEPRATLRTCERCAPRLLQALTAVHAEGNILAFAMNGNQVQANGIWLAGRVSLSAHSETYTFSNYLAISAHQGVLRIAATLPIEEYVQRVVASESGPDDSIGSLEALAIVVRSFALHVNHGHAGYDLCDSTHCQLLHWGGNPGRREAAHAATLMTAGETLWFHGQRALAYFSKDCGGHTASPDEIWAGARAPAYLPSQPDQHDSEGGSEWATELTRAELTTALADARLVRPGWRTIAIARRGGSGRAIMLRIDSAEVSGEDFRLAVGKALGWNRLPSTWFELNQQGDTFLFHGRGMGHGVGLCQRGAAAMAGQRGNTAQQILAHYFPGATPADEATGGTWQQFIGEGFRLESLDANDSTYLPRIEQARDVATQRSGLKAQMPFVVRTFSSTAAFRDATLAPGWVAAFTEGDWIGTQPLRRLDARHLLDATLLHEFLHALVEQQAGAHTALWLREGLVEIWSKPVNARHEAAALCLGEVDAALVHASTEKESSAAHLAAEWYTVQLLDRYGRTQVLAWLHSGIPAGAVAAVNQR